MYLDQPGLMGLWDRMKAVFAPKKHTHQASDVSGVVADVRMHGASITKDGVADIPLAKYNTPGVCGIGTGLLLNSAGTIRVQDPATAYVDARKTSQAVTCSKLDYAVKAAMCDGQGAAWTATEQAAARKRMGITEGGTGGGTVSRFWFSHQAPGEDIETHGYFGFKLTALESADALNATDYLVGNDIIMWNGYAYFVTDNDGNEALGEAKMTFARDAEWTTAYGMSASVTLAASSTDIPLTKSTGAGSAATLESSGLKMSRTGTVLATGSISLGSGFHVGDLVHLRVAKNGSHTGADIVHVMPASSGGTVQITTVVSVTAGDVLTLRAWNASAARGTVSANTSTRLTVAYL